MKNNKQKPTHPQQLHSNKKQLELLSDDQLQDVVGGLLLPAVQAAREAAARN
jgi:hypothetical protein